MQKDYRTLEEILRNPVYTKIALGLAFTFIEENSSKDDLHKIYVIAPDGQRIYLADSVNVVKACADAV